MAWSLIANGAAASNQTSLAVTASLNTSWATLLVGLVTQYSGVSAISMSDSKSNTWTALTVQSGGIARAQLFYCNNPIVGSGHTFQGTPSTLFYGTIEVQAWSGNDTSSPFDAENGALASGVTTISTGSVTPAASGALLVAGCCPTDGTSSTVTIDNSFTISDQNQFNSGTWEGGALAYLVHTSGAMNPAFSWSGSSGAAAVIAAFKVAGGGGPTLKLFTPSALSGLGSGGAHFQDRLS